MTRTLSKLPWPRPYGDGWFYRIRFSNADEIEDLLSPEDYAEQGNI